MSSKVRKIGIKTNSIVTKFFSFKMNRYVECESLLESNLCYLFEFDKDVKKYQEQPFKINLNGKSYTPDFYVLYEDGKEEVYEIKESSKLKDLADKLEMAKKHFSQKGILFIVLTEDFFKNQVGIKLQNLKFLYRFIQPPKQLETYEKLLIDELKKHKKIIINQFIESLKDSEKLQILPIIWHLIAKGVIKADLENPLNNYSFIHID